MLAHLLLGYLQSALSWPGGDGLTIEEVWRGYVDALGRGSVPSVISFSIRSKPAPSPFAAASA